MVRRKNEIAPNISDVSAAIGRIASSWHHDGARQSAVD